MAPQQTPYAKIVTDKKFKMVLNKKRGAITKMKFKMQRSLKGYTNMKLQPIKKVSSQIKLLTTH